jgi:hypothetical protein
MIESTPTQEAIHVLVPSQGTVSETDGGTVEKSWSGSIRFLHKGPSYSARPGPAGGVRVRIDARSSLRPKELWDMSGTDRSRLLVLMGWGVVVLVAIVARAWRLP